MANINFFFEGKNFVQLGYQKDDDYEFRAFSWSHGAKSSLTSKRFNLLNKDSRILSPGFAINETKQSMIGMMFVEYQKNSESAPWTLTAFQPRSEPYFEFVDSIPASLK